MTITAPTPTRGQRFAALAVPSWIMHPGREHEAADWLREQMNARPMSDCPAVSISWCIRQVSKMRAGVIDGSRKVITYRDPVGEHVANRLTYGGRR